MSTGSGSCRNNSGDSAAKNQLDGDTSTARSVLPPAVASSGGYEVEDISPCQLSSGAIQAPSPPRGRGNHDFFGFDSSYTGQDVLIIPRIIPPPSRAVKVQGISTRQLSSEAIRALSVTDNSRDVMGGNPLLSSIQDGRTKNAGLPADAFSELFKAISNLNRQSSTTSAELSLPDVVSNLRGTESCLEDGEKVDIPGTAPLIADGKMEESQLKTEVENNIEEMKSCDRGADRSEFNDSGTSAANEEMQPSKPSIYANDVQRQRHSLACKLGIFLKRDPYETRNFNDVMKLFDEVRHSPHDLLKNKQIIDIFVYVAKSDLIAGYDVLKYHVRRCKAQGRLVPLNMYHRLTAGFRGVELQLRAPRRKTNPKTRPLTMDEVQYLVEDITQHIQEEYSEGKNMVYQHLLLPEFVLALSCHRNPYVSAFAKPIMEHILDNNFPQLNPELYEAILEKATHRNTGSDGLPHHAMLSQLVSNGYRPEPKTVLSLLHCYHPFTDIEATHEILSAIKKLHPERDPENDSPPSASEDYSIELGILESISLASARKNIELNLLVWDMVELFGYTPTESMFEDVIMSFAATKQDENLYSAMVDMEKNGFVPTHSLLRYVAVKVGFNQKRLDHSQRMLSWHGNEHMRSTHTMNAVMMGYGMKRNINSAFLVYEDLARFNLEPDVTTFWFLLEVLYIDTKSRFPYDAENPPQFNPEEIEDVVGAAQIIIDAMEEAGIEKTKHFFHEHIRVLCALGKLDDANLVFEEALRTGTSLPAQSLFLLATRFSDRGEFDKAFAVTERSVEAGCGELRHLYNRINNIKSGKKRIPG